LHILATGYVAFSVLMTAYLSVTVASARVGSPAGIAPAGSHSSVREPLGSYGSYRPAKERPQSVTQAQWANRRGARATNACHHARSRR